MKVLFVGRQNKTLSIDQILNRLSTLCELTIIKFSPEEYKNIKSNILNIDESHYDCILFNIPIRKYYNKQYIFQNFSKAVFLDYDTCRNFLPWDSYYQKYTNFFKKFPHFKLISTGYANTQRFKELGIDAYFISKGYDDKNLKNLNQLRDINLGFIGRIDDKLYKDRQKILIEIKNQFDLELLRTKNSQEYLETLNRIKIFVSADIGYNEYMAKNFEAMACGCLVLAKKQGNGEEEALGFKDMHNIVLYNNLNDAIEKIKHLNNNSKLIDIIAKNGQNHIETYFTHSKKAEEIFEVLQSTFRRKTQNKSFLFKILKRIYCDK